MWYYKPVKITLTAKLKLNHSPEQKIALDLVSLRYRDALNFTSKRAFEEGKTSQTVKLQKLVYEELRSKFDLPAQMACNVPRAVASTYKTQWTKHKQHSAKQTARAERGLKTRQYKGLDTAPKFVSRTLTYNYQRDYSFKKGQQVSILTLEGRMTLKYEGYQKHLEYIVNGAEIGAAKLWYDKAKKQYYLLVSFELAIPDPTPSSHKNVVGVDLGQRYHAVVTDTRNQTQFFSGGETNQKKNQYARTKAELQRKDTRSATRRLVALSGRERRFIADRNHKIAAQILTRYPQSVIGLEDLAHIRERTEGHSNPKASKRAKSARKRRSQWSFAETQMFLAYKALMVGSMAVKVDAHYTSQQCVKCGHTSRTNRPQKGLMFVCEVCGYQVHSDLLGSRNIALRTLLVRQDWTSTGILSASPNVSNVEDKAVRLSRYAELRWSSDTNPDLHRLSG